MQTSHLEIVEQQKWHKGRQKGEKKLFAHVYSNAKLVAYEFFLEVGWTLIRK